MSAIPMANVTPLAGGSFFSGCAFAITFQMLNDYGLSLNVLNDKSRQSILNLIALVGSTAGFIAYCYNQTKESITMINITAFILFASVQYGLYGQELYGIISGILM
ncbi:hypothetical protein ROZALSC1DRAFT_27576 [Rozella allomycis CSF55]|uniref:Uncharacterized protein n=1 Tax=Rozella allomycis (strain CSF55) TaxID=988480 RepID=A0A4P9YMP6_ROZAC|nr:hypothetical protein ROZALSC1DRAFT_27576 [Rozella allomycis CSF55]